MNLSIIPLLWNNSSKEEKKSGNKLKLANYLWMYQLPSAMYHM